MFPSIRRGQAVPRVLHFGCRVEADEGALISPMIDQRAVNRRLHERRRPAAEHRWRCYEFGSEVLGQGAWTQHGRDGGYWRRPVSVLNGGTSIEVVFPVTFAPNTNHMIEAYAETVGDPPLLVGRWSDDVQRAA